MTGTFAELWAKVPKNRRTDRVCVLLLLWVKSAFDAESAIPSKDLTDELRARMRANAPQNIPDVLSKASVEIERVQGSGRSSRWYLTGSGIARLQELGLVITPRVKSSTSQFDFDVAFVCALHDPELTALLQAFGGEPKWRAGPSSGQPHIYKVTESPTELGDTLRIIAGAPT